MKKELDLGKQQEKQRRQKPVRIAVVVTMAEWSPNDQNPKVGLKKNIKNRQKAIFAEAISIQLVENQCLMIRLVVLPATFAWNGTIQHAKIWETSCMTCSEMPISLGFACTAGTSFRKSVVC